MSLLIRCLVFPLFFLARLRSSPYGLFVAWFVRSLIRHPASAAGEKNRCYLDDASLARESFPLPLAPLSLRATMPLYDTATRGIDVSPYASLAIARRRFQMARKGGRCVLGGNGPNESHADLRNK